MLVEGIFKTAEHKSHEELAESMGICRQEIEEDIIWWFTSSYGMTRLAFLLPYLVPLMKTLSNLQEMQVH